MTSLAMQILVLLFISQGRRRSRNRDRMEEAHCKFIKDKGQLLSRDVWTETGSLRHIQTYEETSKSLWRMEFEDKLILV